MRFWRYFLILIVLTPALIIGLVYLAAPGEFALFSRSKLLMFLVILEVFLVFILTLAWRGAARFRKH